MEFLRFEQFISIPALIVFYYMGAVIMPVFIWLLSKKISQRLSVIKTTKDKADNSLWGLLSKQQKELFIVLFVSLFFFIQLMWRIMFEFLIAYMQMHDAVVG